jgi:thiol-disulfide isomerase/thioredoxin
MIPSLRILFPALLLAAAGTAAAGEDPLRFGAPVHLRDTAGNSFTVPAADKKATVLVFLLTDCPIANNYAPEIERIRKKYEEKGVAFLRVYVDPDYTADDIAAHTKAYSHASPAVIEDKEHTLARRTGAQITPETVVLDPQGAILYRGRIDDRYVELGRYRPKAQTHDLRNALDAVLGGKTPDPARTKAFGCFIPLELSAKPE